MRSVTQLSAIVALTLSLNATETYTADDLILKALENSPDLKISSYDYEASKSRYDQAFSDYLPTLDLHFSTGIGQVSDNVGLGGEMVKNKTSLGGISAKQLIYDFGKTGGSSDSFKFDSEAFSSEHQQLISDKKRDVKTAYNQVLQAIALIKVQEENVKLNEIQLYRAKEYFTSGIRTQIDISDAKASLLYAKLALKNADYDMKLAYVSLDETVGFKAVTNDYVVYTQELDFKNLYPSLNAYPLTLEASVEFAYANRDELKKQQLNIASAKATSTEASSDYYPSIYLDGGYTKQESDKLKNVLPQEQWKVTANIDWNLYRGGATSAASQEKEIEVYKAKTNLLYSKLSIKTDTTSAYLNVHRAKDSVELSQKLLEVSAEKFDQASERYVAGLSDYIELQQARQDYIDVKASLVVDYYNFYNAVAILDNAIGK